MNKVALICCYYGKWPNYFNLWLKGAEYNSDYDFYFVTDLKIHNKPQNVHIINYTFFELREKIQSFFDFKIKLLKPYKLCDFKCFQANLFSELLSNYEFWGFFDIDTVLGKFNHFISPYILNSYDKIYEQGHLQIIRNNKKMNNLFRSDRIGKFDTYRDAFTTKRTCHFDEAGIMACDKELGFRFYKHPQDMADIDSSSFRFKCFAVKNYNYPPSVIVWKDGILYIAFVVDNKVKYQEIDYAHFQKRRMENCVTNIENGFIAIPNKFIDYQEITADFIIENSPINYNYKEYKKASRKLQFRKLFDGTVPHRIKLLFK